jgi:hypothetical protein
LDQAQPPLDSCHDVIGSVAILIPSHQFWRWKDMWINSLRSIVFSALLVHYLAEGTLMSLQAVSERIGGECKMWIQTYNNLSCAFAVKTEWKDRFEVATEDYLHAVITLVNELVCENMVHVHNF